MKFCRQEFYVYKTWYDIFFCFSTKKNSVEKKQKESKDTMRPTHRSQHFCDSTNVLGKNYSCGDVQSHKVHGDVQPDIPHGDVQPNIPRSDLLTQSLR